MGIRNTGYNSAPTRRQGTVMNMAISPEHEISYATLIFLQNMSSFIKLTLFTFIPNNFTWKNEITMLETILHKGIVQ